MGGNFKRLLGAPAAGQMRGEMKRGPQPKRWEAGPGALGALKGGGKKPKREGGTFYAQKEGGERDF